MALRIAAFLDEFPDHAQAIGEILLSYAHLEFMMCDIVELALDSDINTAIRMLYRLRGANERVNAADAVLRPYMLRLKLIGPYGQWLGAMRRCRVIRNQYAHCAWLAKDGDLTFASLEEAAQSSDGHTMLTFYRIGLDLLEEQLDFFDYTSDVLRYVSAEARYLQDRRRRHRCELPKSRATPSLYSPER